jgi:hypothetical protein
MAVLWNTVGRLIARLLGHPVSVAGQLRRSLAFEWFHVGRVENFSFQTMELTPHVRIVARVTSLISESEYHELYNQDQL